MPCKVNRTHPGQAAGSARKRRNKKLRQIALREEARELRVSVAMLLRRKYHEVLDIVAEAARRRAKELEVARREQERWDLTYRSRWGYLET
jgi:hypothetical protein